MIILYRILTYLLIPFVLVFGLIGAVAFFIALANPALFLGVFVLAAFVIYFICTFRFLHSGILRKQHLRPKLRDWIKVNSYVTLPFAVVYFMQSFSFVRNPSSIDESMKEMADMQSRLGLPAQPAGAYNSIMLAMLYVMIVFAIALLVHIILTFSFLKKYDYLFSPNITAE